MGISDEIRIYELKPAKKGHPKNSAVVDSNNGLSLFLGS